ncbi:MAG: BatA domain-containing protein [Ferruginibacter sp.]|nr:BatA domain-containing protein [Cytophagales bacterium]
MNFLYPSFLFGFFAIAVPVAIHLFNFRRTKKVYFTNVEFLRAVKTTTNSFRKLKQWLILAARVLFVLFLVLTFAQPFVASSNQAVVDGRGIKSIYLDNSLSMENQSGNERYLDLATDKASDLLNTLPNSPSFQLITNDFDSQEQYAVGADKVRDRLTQIRFSPTYRSLATLYQRQRSLLERHSTVPQNQLFWISDFQKSTVGELDQIRLDSVNRFYLVPVQAKEYRNVYIDSVWLATPFVRETQNNELSIRLVNSGNEDVAGLSAKLFVDDAQVSTTSANLRANGSAVATFNFTLRSTGFRRGRISFEDNPVTFDNEYFFVLNASPSIQITHLTETPAGTVNYLSDVFSNESAFRLQSFNARNVDNERLVRSDLVILEGITRLDATLRATLDRFVRNGGSLFILPPARPDPGFYGSWLGGLGVRGVSSPVSTNVSNASPNVSTSGSPAGPPAGSVAATPAPPQMLAPPDRRQPFFNDIFENTTQAVTLAMPVATPVLNWQLTGSRLLAFKDNQPFLSQARVQRGKVYLCASPLAAAYGNFATHALFVPVLYKIATLSKIQEPLAYSFQEQAIALEIPTAQANAIYKLRKDKPGVPQGTAPLEIIPDQRVNDNQLILELPKGGQAGDRQVLESGYYELRLGEKTERLMAFNYDKKESQMAFYTPAELKRRFANQKNVQVFDTAANGDFAQEFREQNIGTNLWKYCLLAALFFLLVEIALIRLVKG